MKKTVIRLTVLYVLISGCIFRSFAQNTFPATGNAGIGTTAPAVPLDVRGLSNFSQQINAAKGLRVFSQSNDLTNGGPWYGIGYVDTMPFGNNIVQMAGYFGLYLKTSRSSLLLTQNGNVGIGTVAPKAALDIAGSFLFYNGKNQDPTLKFNKTGWSRINAPNCLSVWANNKADSNDAPQLFISAAGNVGIGTVNPLNKLSVNGNVQAMEVKVTTAASDWPDYVFKPGYRLLSLSILSDRIKKAGRLPDMPSADDVEINGINLGQLNKLQQQKIEELTLYLIAQDKQLKEQKRRSDRQQQEIDELKKEMSMLLKQKQ